MIQAGPRPDLLGGKDLEQDIGTALLRRFQLDANTVALRLIAGDGSATEHTGAQLHSRAGEFADRLSSYGPGSLVGICLYHGLDLYAAFVGAVWAGHVPTMLPPPSPRIEAAKYRRSVEHMFQYVRPAVTVLDSRVRRGLAEAVGDSVLAGSVIVDPADVSGGHVSSVVPRDMDDIALVQHSSGTSGLQKGVALTHRAIFEHNRRYVSALEITPADRIVSWLPLYHDMGFIACFLLPFLNRVEVTAISPFDWVQAPSSLLKTISRYSATLCWLPNFAYSFLARSFRGGEADLDLSSIRAWVNCSEPVMAASHKAFLEKLGAFGASVDQLTASYAMAENVFAVTQSVPGSYREISVDPSALSREHTLAPSEELGAVRLVSNGPPLQGNEIRIVGESGALPPGKVGEIEIRSPHLFSGYYRAPEASGAAFTADGWFRTGDLGALDNGELFVTGRKKDLIIIQGRNFYPTDIEACVAGIDGIMPGRVVAFGVADSVSGTEGLVVLAEITDEESLPATALMLQVRLAISQQFDCTPHAVKLLPGRWLVKSSSGKVARSDNREKYLSTLAAVAERTGV